MDNVQQNQSATPSPTPYTEKSQPKPVGATVRAFDGSVGQVASAPFYQYGEYRQMVVCDGAVCDFLVEDLELVQAEAGS